MSDTNDDLFIERDDEGNEYVRIPVDQATKQRELARKATQGEKDSLDLVKAQRELAFLKAGIDSESPLGKLFITGYAGDLTPEAIKQEATQIPGLLGTSAEGEGEGEQQHATPEEIAEQRLRQQLATGTPPGTPPPPDPREESVKVMEQARKDGVSEDKVLALGFGVLREAANRGDERVTIDTWGSRNSA